ncbi:MAG: DUF3048 domain-containing protein, partial [Bacillota bacterium]|nr:DUF3048 domain-containing protein [Bacillota bacterium]
MGRVRKRARRNPGKKRNKLVIIVASLAVAVIAIGAIGVISSGGNILGGLPDTDAKAEIISPLTGQNYTEELPARPLVVSIDNVGDAIPQSWLSKADLVYEFPVEGNQTRLQAVYYGQFPDEFGPVRSTRPYFVDLAREYKGIFLAHGWSPQAKTYLLSDVVPYINAMNSDCKFYRVSDKSAPHNSYIKWEEVKGKIDQQGWWDEKQDIRAFKFLHGAQQNEGAAATTINVSYSSSKCEFTYDAQTGKYTRTISGKAYIDKETGESITVSNILVQKVTSSNYDSYGRLNIDMCAGGEAILFTNGVAVTGSWSRSDLDSRTIFIDSEGN